MAAPFDISDEEINQILERTPERRWAITQQYWESRRELGKKFDEFQKALGMINKLTKVIPVTQAAIQFVFAALPFVGTLTVVSLVIIVALVALSVLFVWYRQPAHLLKVQGAHDSEAWNPANSVDRENLVRVQSAAGLIPTLQLELIRSRELDQRITAALAAIAQIQNIPGEKRQTLNNLLGEMQQLAEQVRQTENPGAQTGLLQELHTLGLRYEFLTAELLLPGGSLRLKVPWRLQPGSSITCNYYAAMMAVLYHAYDRSPGPDEKKSYARELEEKIMSGRQDPPRSCPRGTDSYLSWAAGQAGLNGFKAERLTLTGSRNGKKGPSGEDWNKIRDIVERTKTPVVIGTNFSSKGSHFITIVGFSEDGREVYVNDPGSKYARSRTKLPAAYREKNSPVHLIDDERWYGGRYPFAYYLTFT